MEGKEIKLNTTYLCTDPQLRCEVETIRCEVFGSEDGTESHRWTCVVLSSPLHNPLNIGLGTKVFLYPSQLLPLEDKKEVKSEDPIFERGFESTKKYLKEKLEEALKEVGVDLYVSLAVNDSTLILIHDTDSAEDWHELAIYYNNLTGIPWDTKKRLMGKLWERPEIIAETIEIAKNFIEQYKSDFAILKKYWKASFGTIEDNIIREKILNDIGYHLIKETVTEKEETYQCKRDLSYKVILHKTSDTVLSAEIEGAIITKDLAEALSKILKEGRAW